MEPVAAETPSSSEKAATSSSVKPSGDQTEVKEVCLIQIAVCVIQHGWGGNTDAGEKAGTERDNRKNGHESAETAGNFAQNCFSHSRFHRIYHSISSIGIGFGLISIEATVPFLTEMTRSAIAVSA